MSQKLHHQAVDSRTTTDATVTNCTGAQYITPAATVTNIKLRIRYVGNKADGSSLTTIIDWQATSDGSTAALLSTKTIYSFQVDASISATGVDVTTSGATIIPTVTGIAATTINWFVTAEYWVQ